MVTQWRLHVDVWKKPWKSTIAVPFGSTWGWFDGENKRMESDTIWYNEEYQFTKYLCIHSFHLVSYSWSSIFRRKKEGKKQGDPPRPRPDAWLMAFNFNLSHRVSKWTKKSNCSFRDCRKLPIAGKFGTATFVWCWKAGQWSLECRLQKFSSRKKTNAFLHQHRLFVLGTILSGAGFRKECCRTLCERFITSMA